MSRTPYFALLTLALAPACRRAEPSVGLAPAPSGPPAGAAATAEQSPGPAPEPSQQMTRSAVPADINDQFLDATKPAAEWENRWEVESREVYTCRDQIVAALALQPGERVADIGTGTGLFLSSLSLAVGDKGKVYGVDIAEKFVAHIQKRAEKEQMTNLQAVLSNERSVCLEPGSVDVVFVCDAYHHFEYHEDMLRSIRSALAPGGRLVIVDFERIPGKSREWLLGHVRAGQEVVQAEIEAAGFRYLDEVAVQGFEENYLIRFVRE